MPRAELHLRGHLWVRVAIRRCKDQGPKSGEKNGFCIKRRQHPSTYSRFGQCKHCRHGLSPKAKESGIPREQLPAGIWPRPHRSLVSAAHLRHRSSAGRKFSMPEAGTAAYDRDRDGVSPRVYNGTVGRHVTAKHSVAASAPWRFQTLDVINKIEPCMFIFAGIVT